MKKLTIKDIKNENKKFEEKKKVILSDDYYVYIYPNFSPVKVNELIRETLTDAQRAEEVGIEFDKISLRDWGIYNIIYKFTDLGIPSDITKKVQIFNEIMNTKFWLKIIQAFPEESINEIVESLNTYSNNFEEFMKKEFGETEQVS